MKDRARILIAIVSALLVLAAGIVPVDDGLTEGVMVYAYPHVLTANDHLFDGDTPIPLTDTTLLLWVDLYPAAFFAHPTAYILITATGELPMQGGGACVRGRVVADPQRRGDPARRGLDAAEVSVRAAAIVAGVPAVSVLRAPR